MYYREKMVPGNLAWKSSEEKRGYSEKQVFVSFGTTVIAAEPGPAQMEHFVIGKFQTPA